MAGISAFQRTEGGPSCMQPVRCTHRYVPCLNRVIQLLNHAFSEGLFNSHLQHATLSYPLPHRKLAWLATPLMPKLILHSPPITGAVAGLTRAKRLRRKIHSRHEWNERQGKARLSGGSGPRCCPLSVWALGRASTGFILSCFATACAGYCILVFHHIA